MDIIEFLMVRRSWRNMCLRCNIVPPEQIEVYKKTRLALVESNALGKSEKLLKEAIQLTAPEWFGDDTKFCLNRNVKCEKHKDTGNLGHSYVLFMGNYTGGALVFEDGTRLEEKYKWHRIDGSIPHWNEPHEGTKYSIILYKSKPFVSKTNNIQARVKQRREAVEVQPPPTTAGHQFVVISLDTDIGKQRRDGLCLPTPYIWSRGVLPEEVPDLVREHWRPSRYKEERQECLMGAFAAHLQAWRTVASMGSPAMIILEDDAKFVRPIPEEFPEGTITLLGGVFRGYGKWCEKTVDQRAYSTRDFIAHRDSFSYGVNELPTQEGSRMRWVMAVAYHLPVGMAAKLVDIVDRTTKKTLRTPDIWLNDYATHFVWPPPFVDQDSTSQCMTPHSCHGSDFYCDGRMLRIADSEPNWINMTDKIRKDFIDAVAKMHNIDTKENV